MNKAEATCKQILTEHSIDIFSEIDFDVNGKVHTLSFNYIIETYMQASDESQEIFLLAMKTSLHVDENKVDDIGINKFFEGMGQLLLMTHLSDKM